MVQESSGPPSDDMSHGQADALPPAADSQASPVPSDSATPMDAASPDTTPPSTSDDEFASILAAPSWEPDAPPPDDATAKAAQEDSADLPATADENAVARKAGEGAEDAEDADRPMGLMDHLNELRSRMVKCCIAVGLGFMACWIVVDPMFDALVAPLLAVLPKGSHAIYTTLPEGFFTRMYIAFVAGVFVSSPVLFYQVWAFISPGLYDEEKRYIIPIAIASALFFICGGAFCYFIVFPYAFSFFVSFATEEIVAMPKVSDYLGFVLKLILAFGLIFEMPLFAFFLARMGLITAAQMRRVRRYAVLTIFIVAAILTPPDVVSQLLMACPMLILYEVSILVAAAVGRKPSPPKPAEAEPSTQDAAEPTPREEA